MSLAPSTETKMPATQSVAENAYPKVNLALHITGQRDDGYHLIDSIVTFPAISHHDLVEVAQRVSDGKGLRLTIEGDEAGSLHPDGDNLVVRAIEVFREVAQTRNIAIDADLDIRLIKRLPVASGIGGGSADAAAALRAMNRLFGNPFSSSELEQIALPLGADIPMCIRSTPARATGIGEILSPIDLAFYPIVLVNPRLGVSTPEVFSSLTQKDNSAIPGLPDFNDPRSVHAWFQTLRNDLTAPAISRQPVIAEVLALLKAQEACLFHAMSGSGATCFALFGHKEFAARAGNAIKKHRPDWWVSSALRAAQ